MGFSLFGGGHDLIFSIFPVIFVVGFVVILGLLITTAIKSGIQWNKNNHSPVLTVDAGVVAKRTAVSTQHHNHNNDNTIQHTSSSTTYFATFEVESGDRIELNVPDDEYGMLAEGDRGRLTFQGTRYKGFERYRG